MKILYLTVFICLQKCLSEISAEEAIRISSTLGENVTLLLSERGINENIIKVAWIRDDGNRFAATTPDGYICIQDYDYEGRLRCSIDASLTIINVTTEDQGLYAAIVFSDEDTNVQKYNLRILAKSPDKVNRNYHKASMLDPCSVSCRRSNRDVTLTCDQTSYKNISAVYDRDTCTCAPWKTDCAPCDLEEYCGKDDIMIRIIRALVVLLVGMVVLFVMVPIMPILMI